MKKKVLIIFAVVALVVVSMVSLVACSDGNFVGVAKQSTIITELNAKTADIGILDSIMAKEYIKSDAIAKDLMIIEGLTLQGEEYGIGCRKGSKGLMDKINTALAKQYANGEMQKLIDKYGLQEELIAINYESKFDTLSAEEKADYNEIIAKGKMVMGITLFAPIAFETSTKEYTGFDVELARLVAAEMGITVEVQVINWDNKEMELRNKNIDLIWNGMTITPDRQAQMEISVPYLKNEQIALIRKADKDLYTKELSTFKGAVIAAERGSAGESIYKSKIKPLMKTIK